MTYGANPFPESLQIAAYIKMHTGKDDRIAVLGSEPQIFFYANRLSATGYIYIYGLMENQKYALQMQQEMIKEIEAAKPKFLVLVRVGASWMMQPNSYKVILDWGEAYVGENCERVGVVDILDKDYTLYLWGRDALHYSPRSKSFIFIYQRRQPA